MSGNLENENKDLIKTLVKKIKEIIKVILKENGIIVISLNIEYFYDGDFADLGVKVQNYNKITKEMNANYFSFMLDSEILYSKISYYLSEFKENEKYSQLKLLAENVKLSIVDDVLFRNVGEITVSCYD